MGNSYRLNVFGFPGARAARENAGFHDARLVYEFPSTSHVQMYLIIQCRMGPRQHRRLRRQPREHDHLGSIRRYVHSDHGSNFCLTRKTTGAGLVGSYIYANPSDPIVTGAIAMSGAVNNPPPDNSSSFTTLAEAAGCGDLSAEEELSCMQNIPALRLQDLIQRSTLPNSNVTTPRFAAVIDNITAFANNTDRLAKNLTAKIVSPEHCPSLRWDACTDTKNSLL